MQTDLDHLPPQKQREIERVVQLIFGGGDESSLTVRVDVERLPPAAS